jgi:ligand-binding SRPBCC domain-containing protein
VTTIQLTTRIEAPVERVYDLSRSIDLHLEGAAASHERAIGGVVEGLMNVGEEVVWSARHFGIRFRMTVCLTHGDPPFRFVDEMTRGPFSQMRHEHIFEQEGTTTVMHDEFRFTSPLGPLGGRCIDRVILRPHLTRFLNERNALIKRVAESEEWKRFLL